VRDLPADLSLAEATQAIDEGQVLLNGAPYAWEPDEMAFWLREPLAEPGEVRHEAERSHFVFPEAPPPGPDPA